LTFTDTQPSSEAAISAPDLYCNKDFVAGDPSGVYLTQRPSGAIKARSPRPDGGGDVVSAMIALREQNTSSESQGDTGASPRMPSAERSD